MFLFLSGKTVQRGRREKFAAFLFAIFAAAAAGGPTTLQRLY